MANLELNAQVREITRRKVKDLRRTGLVPVVIYGKQQAPENIQVDAAALDRVLQAGGSSQLIKVQVEGSGLRNVLVREIQRHPVRNVPIHADFYAVNMTEKQHVNVPVVATGRAAGAGADIVLVQALDHVSIEALPADIPAHIEVDVSPLEGPGSPPITVADLPQINGVTYLTPAEEAVFSLVLSRAAVEEEETVESVAAEPEVIGRERDEDDEDTRGEADEE